MSLLVIGTLAFDTIITPENQSVRVIGGSANYFALASSFLNSVQLISVVGSDFPEEHLDFLHSRNINVDGVLKKEGETFEWVGKYENIYDNAETQEKNKQIIKDFTPILNEQAKSAKYVYLAKGHPETQNYVLSQIKNPHYVVATTAEQWIASDKPKLLELMQNIDAIIITPDDAKLLTEKKYLFDAVSEILVLGPWQVIVYSKETGAVLYSSNNPCVSPMYPLDKIVDPTGSIDCFAGGYLGYLSYMGILNQAHHKKALKYGIVLARFINEGFYFSRLQEIKRVDIQRRLTDFEEML
ncbi:MAG: hypothetical protein K8S87_08915 [Planctomycetes bacterium]|nr:hypothetical protein [Planctomycetota bacterium]